MVENTLKQILKRIFVFSAFLNHPICSTFETAKVKKVFEIINIRIARNCHLVTSQLNVKIQIQITL